jgi:Protein ENHANCED DISEASE RESISTANCE 2, C-terminal
MNYDWQRFLNGDDEYRNRRFKCLPVLVDGPAAIRYVAPTTRNTATIATPTLPITWKKHPPTYDSNGQTVLHPCLEVECDLMVNRTKRSMAALVKRYLKNMVGEVAILIEKPYLQEEEEPRACLGMCRFDRIDVQTCPEMPQRDVGGDTEEEQEIRRASFALGRPVSRF